MTTLSLPLKRVKRKIKKCQNPLFEKWLKEWREEAKRNGSEMQYCFGKALTSLQKFPFKLNTGKECIILENFGSKICQMLDKKLEEYNENNPTGVTVKITNQSPEKQANAGRKRKSSETSEEKNKKSSVESSGSKESITEKTSNYIPATGSGGYAILVAMFEQSQEESYKGYLTKSEIQNSAQNYCQTSFTVPKPGSHYTAWSSMASLIKKNLVVKHGNTKFNLTESGTELAVKLKLAATPAVSSQDLLQPNTPIVNSCEETERLLVKSPQKVGESQRLTSPNVQVQKLSGINGRVNSKESDKNAKSKLGVASSSSVMRQLSPSKEKCMEDIDVLTQAESIPEKNNELNAEVDETIFMLPNTFKVILIVDNQERDNKFQQRDQMTVKHLKSTSVDFEMRHLKVGDFIWVARNDDGKELVLPYVVERKRMDDLGSSIKDGRFHEQKFRLKQSGLENLIYLVEKYGSENQRFGLPLPTLMQAISNTQVVDGFTVKMTNSHNHSMRYLDCMTTQLNTIFKGKTLMSCKKSNLTSINLADDLISLMTFNDFNKGSEKSKKVTVRNMLIKHLLQLSGISVEKAKAIVQIYPTPKLLMEAMADPNGEKTIAKLTYGSFNRSIGPVAAKQIQLLYSSIVLR